MTSKQVSETNSNERALIQGLPTLQPIASPFSLIVKKIFFPGVDVSTWYRARYFRRRLRRGDLLTLDAGCGNGALAYEAYKVGNRVIGVTLDSHQVERNNTFFASKKCDSSRIHFKTMNLYKLDFADNSFDQIICSETIEHITNHKHVLKEFYRILKPQGLLHLCAPYQFHPDHNLGRVNNPEDGGHVRDGYTIDSMEALIQELGFKKEYSANLVNFSVWEIFNRIDRARVKYGEKIVLPLSYLVRGLVILLDRTPSEMPHSIYTLGSKR